jgi:hypothetical protein
VCEIFLEIEENYGFEIQQMSVAPDHVHLFLSFPPRYLIAHVDRGAEEYYCDRIVLRICGIEERVAGRGVFGGWIFCLVGGTKDYSGFEQALYQL